MRLNGNLSLYVITIAVLVAVSSPAWSSYTYWMDSGSSWLRTIGNPREIEVRPTITTDNPSFDLCCSAKAEISMSTTKTTTIGSGSGSGATVAAALSIGGTVSTYSEWVYIEKSTATPFTFPANRYSSLRIRSTTKEYRQVVEPHSNQDEWQWGIWGDFKTGKTRIRVGDQYEVYYVIDEQVIGVHVATAGCPTHGAYKD